ncbi:DUF6118 family protein [Pectobacterium colocasium]
MIEIEHEILGPFGRVGAEAARTAGSDQQCTITVKAPAAPAQ